MYHAHPQFRYGGGIWMVQRIRDATANTFSFRFIKVTRTKENTHKWINPYDLLQTGGREGL